MAGKQPRQGWIYTINSDEFWFKDKSFLDKKKEQPIYSMNFGGSTYLVWKNNKSQQGKNSLQTLTVIPLTVETTWVGLPTTYPITATKRNQLSTNFYGLIHQVCIIDGNLFQDNLGNWLPRIGQLDKNDKEKIEERLSYYLSSNRISHTDQFKNHISPKLLEKIYENLQGEKKEEILKNLLDEF